MSEDFDSILHFDPLLEAEKVTGKSYKEDPGTQGLGFLLLQESAQRKKDELMLRGDFYRNIPFTEAVDIARDAGFTPVWVHHGPSNYGDPQHTIMLWSDGILLKINDYRGNLNEAYIFFNWRPFSGKSNEFAPIFQFPISGGMEHKGEGFDDIEGDPWVFVGNIHVVEGFKHYVEKLRASGEILTEWYITDDLLGVRIGDELHDPPTTKKWPEQHAQIKATIRKRVAEFSEPARSAIQAGFQGKDWE
jgi:hypothetical protein